MQQTSTPRTRRRRLSAFLLTAAATSLAACGTTDRTVTDPSLPGNPAGNPQLRRASFVVDVNTATRTVKITEPMSAFEQSFSFTGRSGGRAIPRPNFSILAGDAVQLTTANYSASAVGAFTPGKIRVSFDVFITNRLSTVQLITPTFPVPPAGTNGIILFPFETNVTVTSGGTSVGGDGTEIIIDQPNTGQVASSIDWDGTPFNFFNDTGCPAGSNDCYRHQVFAQPLGGGSTSEAQRVGFDIDPTVATFRARLIVAADLQNSGPAATGTISGSVTSPQRGALSGVTVSATPGTASGSTDGAGGYSLTSVATGPKTVALSSLPAGCTNPGSQNTTVTNGGTSTVNFVVTCTPFVGTVAGTISSSLGGGLSGVSVVVTPTAGAAQPAVTSSGSGAYSRDQVPVGAGTGSIALSNLPAGCTNPGTSPYSGLTNGGTVIVDITVPCTPPPQGYNYTASWGAISGGQVTLTLSIDMGTFNDPAVNGAGADDVFAIQLDLSYNSSRLQFGSCSNVAGSGLTNGAFNGSTAGQLSVGNFTTSPPEIGLQGIASCTFTVLAGAPLSVTTASTITAAESQNSNNLIPNILKTEGTLNIP